MDPIILTFEDEGLDDVISDIARLSSQLAIAQSYLTRFNRLLTTTTKNATKYASAVGAAASANAAFAVSGGNLPQAIGGGSGGGRGRSGYQGPLPPKYKQLKQPVNPWMRAVMSSRISYSNGHIQAMPLVNQLVSAAVKTNPELLGAVAAIAAFGAAASMAKDRVLDFAKNMTGTGATPGETALGMRMGGALGFDWASRAQSFQSAIGSPGAGMSFARKYGINPFANSYGAGDQDFGGKLNQFLKTILDPSKTSNREALVAARATGNSDLLWSRYASKGVRDDYLNKQDRAYDPKEMRAAADAQIRLNTAMYDFNKQLSELGTAVLPYLTKALKALNKLVNPKGGYITNPKGIGKGKENPSEKMDKAANKFHAGVDKFAGIMDGLYGGGGRSRGAIPQLGPKGFDQITRGHAINLGAFTGV